MAQYYHIVGQRHSLTLEDLQRYCPNLCLDGIIVNQDDQQYGQQQVVVQATEQPSDIIVSEGVQPQAQLVVGDGLQYQQQYIIRHEPPPPPPPRSDFKQPQQQRIRMPKNVVTVSEKLGARMLRRSRRNNQRRRRSVSARSDSRGIEEVPAIPGGPVGPAAEPQSAKMLIILQHGEERLITFTLPKQSCTLQEVLEQVNVDFTEDTHIQCMQTTSSEIDYFVLVGSTMRIEELYKNHPMLVGDVSSRSSPNIMSQPHGSEMSTPESQTHTSPESPPRYVDGMLGVCKCCGYSGFDLSRCQRCKRVFTEEPNRVPTSKKLEQKTKEQQEPITEKPRVNGDGSKLNLPKNSLIKAMNSEASEMPLSSERPERAPEVPAASNEPNFEVTVQSIMDMGFNRQQVEQALRASFNNKEQAVEYLITNISQEWPQEHKADESSGESPLAFLRGQPQFQQMRAVVKQKPKLLNAVLHQIGQFNPALLQTIGQHQQEFIQMLVEPVRTPTGAASAEEGAFVVQPAQPHNVPRTPTGAASAEEGALVVQPPQPHNVPRSPTGADSAEEDALVVQPPQPQNVSQMSSKDKEAIDRLKELGFPEHVVIDAYFACENDENRAANFILSQSF